MGIDSQGLEVGEDTQTHKISTSEHALFWPQDPEFDEQSNLIRRSAGAFGELGFRQLILVPRRLLKRRLVGHEAASYTHLVTSAIYTVGARPKPGSTLNRVERKTFTEQPPQGLANRCPRLLAGCKGR